MRSVSMSLLVCLCLICAEAVAENTSVMLVISPVVEDFFQNAQDGRDPGFTENTDELIVIGTINAPTFSVEGINSVSLSDADGNPISLTIDQFSLYSEFDDGVYNSMRMLFTIPENILEKGALRLTWGDDISANNRQIEHIPVYLGEKERYRTFTWEEQPEGDDGAGYAATVEVIVDNYADTYYLWYLLPMVLIFTLLFVKKIALK